MSLSRLASLRKSVALFPVSLSCFVAISYSPVSTIHFTSVSNVVRRRFSTEVLFDDSHCISPKSFNSIDISPFTSNHAVFRPMLHSVMRSPLLLPFRFKHDTTKKTKSSVSKSEKLKSKTIWYRLVDKNGQYIGNASKILVTTGSDLNKVLKKVKLEEPSKISSSIGVSDINVYGSSKIVDISSLLKGEQIDVGMKVVDLLKNSIGKSSKNPLIVQVPIYSTGFKNNNVDVQVSYIQQILKSETIKNTYVPLSLNGVGMKLASESSEFMDFLDIKVTPPYDRDFALNQTYLFFAQRYNARFFGSRKEINTIVTTNAAPGSGKTFYLDLLAILFGFNPKAVEFGYRNPDFVKYFPFAVGVPITFNSFMNASEDSPTLAISHRIAIRALYSYFTQVLVTQENMDWKEWMELFKDEPPKLNQAIFLISDFHSRYVSKLQTEQQHVILLVDEIMCLKSEDLIYSLLTELGLAEDLFRNVHVVVSSLSMLSLAKQTPSGRILEWVRLTSLSYESSLKLMDPESMLPLDTPRRDEMLKIVQYMTYATGGHPRTIVALRAFFRKLTKSSNAFLSTSLLQFVKSTYFSKCKIAAPSWELIDLALSGKKVTLGTEVSKLDKTVDDCIATAKLFNSVSSENDVFVPRLLPLQLLAASNSTVDLERGQVLQYMLDYTLPSLSKGKPFERLMAGWQFIIGRTKRLHYAATEWYTDENFVSNGIPFMAYFYPFDSSKNNRNISFSWGPRVSTLFQMNGFYITPETKNKPFPSIDPTEVVVDQNGYKIPLHKNVVIVSGTRNESAYEYLMVFTGLDGKKYVIAVNTKFGFVDTLKSHSKFVSAANDYYAEILVKFKNHLVESDDVQALPKEMHCFSYLKLTKDRIFFLLVSTHPNVLTEKINDNVLILGREDLLHSLTTTLEVIGMFNVEKNDFTEKSQVK